MSGDDEEILALMAELIEQYRDTDNNVRAFAAYWRGRALIDARDRVAQARVDLEEVAA